MSNHEIAFVKFPYAIPEEKETPDVYIRADKILSISPARENRRVETDLGSVLYVVGFGDYHVMVHKDSVANMELVVLRAESVPSDMPSFTVKEVRNLQPRVIGDDEDVMIAPDERLYSPIEPGDMDGYAGKYNLTGRELPPEVGDSIRCVVCSRRSKWQLSASDDKSITIELCEGHYRQLKEAEKLFRITYLGG
jgi:hypothetical protein